MTENPFYIDEGTDKNGNKVRVRVYTDRPETIRSNPFMYGHTFSERQAYANYLERVRHGRVKANSNPRTRLENGQDFATAMLKLYNHEDEDFNPNDQSFEEAFIKLMTAGKKSDYVPDPWTVEMLKQINGQKAGAKSTTKPTTTTEEDY